MLLIKEYLEGFECERFKIVEGCYISKYLQYNDKINNIYQYYHGVEFYNEDNRPIALFLNDTPNERKIIKNMMSYYKYNKRKQIIENL